MVVAREFGRSAETDGFFAAYGVFVVLSIVAGSVRVIAQPPLARARLEGALGNEASAWAAALAVATLPLVLASLLFAGPIGDALTGSLPPEAADVASETLVWLVPAAVLQLFAALCAGILAALDDYGTAATGYVVGSLAGLALILARVGDDGIVAVAWGAALNGAVAVAIPAARLAWRHRPRRPAPRVVSRLSLLVRGSVLPLVLQALYLVCLRMSTEIGVGELTTFSYAYLIASALVAVTATSLGLVTSVPLARAGLDDDAAARHVVGSSWLSLALVAGAAGIFAVAGDALVRLVLGDAYEGGGIGALVVALSPWAVASIGVTLTYPLVFVRGRPRRGRPPRPRCPAAAPARRLARPRGARARRRGARARGLDGAPPRGAALEPRDPRRRRARARARDGDGRRSRPACLCACGPPRARDRRRLARRLRGPARARAADGTAPGVGVPARAALAWPADERST